VIAGFSLPPHSEDPRMSVPAWSHRPLIAAGCALLLLVALAPAPAAAEEIPTPAEATAASPESAASGPAQRVEPGAKTRLRLDATAPTVGYSGYITYYNAFEVVAPADGPLALSVESFCACVGFDKKLGIPVALVFDASGKPVAVPDLARADDGFAIARIRGHFQAKQGQAYRILVMTDNANLGSTVSVVDIGTTTGSSVLSIPTRAVPGGKMRLTIGGKQ
jgi:hypothetical protein